MGKNARIPRKFQVGGTEIEVKREAMLDSNAVGISVLSGGYIAIADKASRDVVQSEDSKVNTFYHELVHCILGTMGHPLNDDEGFVCAFSGFLTEAMRGAEFKDK